MRLLSIIYSIVCFLTKLALLQIRDCTARDIELVAVRHEVRVLRRQTKRTSVDLTVGLKRRRGP